MDGGLLEILGSEAPRWRQRMRRRRFNRGTVIFHEGDVGDTLHVIDKGRVLIEVTTARGDAAALSVRGPGEILGEMAILGDGRRTARVTTLERTETLSLSYEALEELRAEDPRVDHYLLELLAFKLQETTAQLVEVLFVSVDKRVLRVVERLADAFDDGGDDPVVVRVRQEDIAAMAGTRRQTANRPLKAAEAAGAIAVRRSRVEILDRDTLAKLAS